MQRLFLLLLIPFVFFSVSAQDDNRDIKSKDETSEADSLNYNLKEVIVNSPYHETILKGNTLVTTVSGTPLADLGGALDVLSRLPMITVRNDEVAVIGKGTPLVYIDNRPVSDGFDLRTLRSKAIKKIELILSPGAEYDASSNAVIKITTRRRFITGLAIDNESQGKVAHSLTGYEMLSGKYLYENGLEIFITGVAAHNNNVMRGSTINRLVWKDHPTVIGSTQDKKSPSDNFSLKAGLNYSHGSMSTGGWYRVLRERGMFSNSGEEWINDESPIFRKINERTHATNHYAQIYFDNTFSNQINFHFDGSFINRNTNNRELIRYPLESLQSNVESVKTRDSWLYAGKVTLSLPLGEGHLISGCESSYTSTTLDSRMLNDYVETYIPTSISNAKQKSVSFFSSYTGQLGLFDITAGFRFEYKDYLYMLDGKKDNNLSRCDRLLTPDVTLTLPPTEHRPLSVSLNYKYFSELPPYSNLTSGLSYVGLHEIEGGNPALRDGRTHQINLFSSYGDFMFQATFRRSFDTYGFIKRLYSSNDLQLLFQPVNFNVSAAWIYFIWEKQLKSWRPSLTVGMNPQWLTLDGTKYNKPIYAWYFDNVVNLPMGFEIIANLYGQSSGNIHTQLFRPKWFMMDASIRKHFLERSLSVKLSFSNIFNCNNDGWRLKSYGVDMNKTQSYDNRWISLGISYSFQPRKSSYKGNEAAESESKRL